MAELSIDFQDGFNSDTVVISADGREVGRAEGVTSRNQIGFAGTITVLLAGGETTLEITLPTRKDPGGTGPLVRRISVDPVVAPHVGISISRDGDVTSRTSATPFGYL